MSRTTAAHEHAIQVLADGQWHDYEKVLWEVQKGVPPHLAIRRAERVRVRNYIRNHPGTEVKDVPPRKRNLKQDTLIRIGAKSYAHEVLANTRFEHAMDPSDSKWVRLRPADPEPLPEGWKRWRKEPDGVWAGLTQDEIKERRRIRAREAMIESMRRRGVVITDDYESVAQRIERKRREWAAMSEEERHRILVEKSKRAARTRLINLGIDPDTHESQREQKKRLKARSSGERFDAFSAASRKGWATRKAKEQQQKENDGI